MLDTKISRQFCLVTFLIAYITSGILIILSKYGYTITSWVETIPQFLMNIPFALYICSPAIASYIVLRKNNKVSGIREWIKTMFYIKNTAWVYILVFILLAIYFTIHLAFKGDLRGVLPLYMLLLSIPGNLFIGGLEEAGWMSALQPQLDYKYGYIKSSLIMGLIWLVWHLPLFILPGTNHESGVIDFWMFAFQIVAFRFVYGALYKISNKSGIFVCILFHTLFNAGSYVFNVPPTVWSATIIANLLLIIVSIVLVGKIGDKEKS